MAVGKLVSLLAMALAAGLWGAGEVHAQDAELAEYATVDGWLVQSIKVDGIFLRCKGTFPGGKAALEASVEGWTLTVPTDNVQDSLQGSITADAENYLHEWLAMDGDAMGAFLEAEELGVIGQSSKIVIKIGDETVDLDGSGAGEVQTNIQECLDNAGEH